MQKAILRNNETLVIFITDTIRHSKVSMIHLLKIQIVRTFFNYGNTNIEVLWFLSLVPCVTNLMPARFFQN